MVRNNSRNREKVVDYQSNQPSPLEKVELEELQQIIHQALSGLSESSRQTAELFYLDEQSCAQVAHTLNVPKGTVKRRLYDTRQKLRDILLSYVEQPEAKRKKKRKYDKRMPL